MKKGEEGKKEPEKAGSSGAQKDPADEAKGKKGAKSKGKDQDLEIKREELSEEDKQLKGEVELLVARVQDANPAIVSAALDKLTEMLRTATGTVASIPKPLKFIRDLFPVLEKTHKEMTLCQNRITLSDVLSLIAMTLELPGELASLEFKLAGTTDDLAKWGHEYLRHLAGEVAVKWGKLKSSGASVDHLKPLFHQIVVFMLSHQDEPAACDLAIEIDMLAELMAYCDETNYARVAQYMLAVSRYVPAPEDISVLQLAYLMYSKFSHFPNGLRIALALQSREKAAEVIASCTNPAMKKQLALMCGRYRIFLEESDEELAELIGNTKLSEWFLYVARDLDCIAPKMPEDIYKTHLMDQRSLPSTTNSHMHNLASTFVNAFANAGYTADKLITVEGTNWIFQTKDHRMMSAAASLGLIHLWDHEAGLAAVDKYSYSEEAAIKAGSLLATGIVMCGVNSPFDPAMALLQDSIEAPNRETKIGALMGLGFAYAGTCRDDVKELLTPIVADASQPVEVQCFAAFALALVFAGSSNEDVSEAIMMCLMEKDETQLAEPCIRYLILALGALFLRRKEGADTLLDAIKALPPTIQKYTEVVALSCAYAGTGNVLTVQRLFGIVAEPPEDTDEKKPAEQKGQGADATPTDKAPDDKTKPKPYNHKAAAVLGIGLIAMGEGIGAEMCRRALLHILMIKDHAKHPSGRRGVPLALALLSVSNAEMQVVEALSKLSHDADAATAQSAILALGIVAAGTNNARVATLLRNLAGYYHKDADSEFLFLVRIAQGLTCLGKGHLSLSPLLSDKLLVNASGLVGLLGVLHSALDFKATILDRYHFMLFCITPAVTPRFLLTVDQELKPVQTQVRVGLAVDTVAMPGKPKTITGFQTLNSPVLLQEMDRAELAVGKHRTLPGMTLDGVVIVEEKPDEEPAGEH